MWIYNLENSTNYYKKKSNEMFINRVYSSIKSAYLSTDNRCRTNHFVDGLDLCRRASKEGGSCISNSLTAALTELGTANLNPGIIHHY